MADLPSSYITLNLKNPPAPPRERCSLLVTFPGGAMGLFYGTRETCEAKWEAVHKDNPEATHEIKPMPEREPLPLAPLPILTHEKAVEMWGEREAQNIEACHGSLDGPAELYVLALTPEKTDGPA